MKRTSDGWESSPNVLDFSSDSKFNEYHRYRRRKWCRNRLGDEPRLLVAGVNAFLHPPRLGAGHRGNLRDHRHMRIGIQTDGGQWSQTPAIPNSGLAFGVMKVRGPKESAVCSLDSEVHELCYRVSPIGGEWGTFSRSMFITSRFFVRNDSASSTFLIKQAGSHNSTATLLLPG